MRLDTIELIDLFKDVSDKEMALKYFNFCKKHMEEYEELHELHIIYDRKIEELEFKEAINDLKQTIKDNCNLTSTVTRIYNGDYYYYKKLDVDGIDYYYKKLDVDNIGELARDLEVQYIGNKYSEYSVLGTDGRIDCIDYHKLIIFLDREYDALLKRLERKGK